MTEYNPSPKICIRFGIADTSMINLRCILAQDFCQSLRMQDKCPIESFEVEGGI